METERLHTFSLSLPPLVSQSCIFIFDFFHHLPRTVIPKPGLILVVQGSQPTLILESLHIQQPSQQIVKLKSRMKDFISYSFPATQLYINGNSGSGFKSLFQHPLMYEETSNLLLISNSEFEE